MQPVMLMKIPKNIAIQNDLSENVVDLVSTVVIPWVFDVDELCERKKQATNTYIL